MSKQQQLDEASGTAQFMLSRDTFACEDLYELAIRGAPRDALFRGLCLGLER
jgi:hypothetical protein